MNSLDVKLKNKEGDYIYPVTRASNVMQLQDMITGIAPMPHIGDKDPVKITRIGQVWFDTTGYIADDDPIMTASYMTIEECLTVDDIRDVLICDNDNNNDVITDDGYDDIIPSDDDYDMILPDEDADGDIISSDDYDMVLPDEDADGVIIVSSDDIQ